jgi:hypothetical protein
MNLFTLREILSYKSPYGLHGKSGGGGGGGGKTPKPEVRKNRQRKKARANVGKKFLC